MTTICNKESVDDSNSGKLYGIVAEGPAIPMSQHVVTLQEIAEEHPGDTQKHENINDSSSHSVQTTTDSMQGGDRLFMDALSIRRSSDAAPHNATEAKPVKSYMVDPASQSRSRGCRTLLLGRNGKTERKSLFPPSICDGIPCDPWG